MDEMKIVIKVCYHGLLRFIICDKTCSYRDILKLAIKVFNIPKEYTAALKITNESGYIFEPKLFEYFIILFPSPEIIFYIRLDYTNKTATLKNERPYPFGYSKFNNKRQRNSDEFSCYGAPVTRQNCFIGTLPSTSTASEEQHNAQEIISQIAKRRRYNEATHKSAAKVTPIKVFNIPKEYTAALKITNESGYIFEPKLFEYFIILFPSPEIIFYIRLDYTNKTATLKNERPYPFGYSKFNNKRQRNSDEFSCYGAPVTRQNCFIGTLPSTSTASEEQNNTQEIISQIAKRRRYNAATHKSVAKITRKNTSMRSIRL